MFFTKRSSPKHPGSTAFRLHQAYAVVVFFCCLFSYVNVSAQKKDTIQKENVSLNATNLYTIKTDSGDLVKFIDKAIFIQGTDTLYCDSLYQHKPIAHPLSAIYEAFGDVKIAQQGGTQGTSNYLRYTSDDKTAFMTGNVMLTDSGSKLKCEELTYNLGTKIGVYDKGGTLYSDSTTVSSNTGIYDVKNKESRFKGNVHIIDPKYKINSQDLGYNTETKFETFYSHSVIISDSGKTILETSSGTYDSKEGIAHFLLHNSIWDDGQYIEGDTLNYNKSTGFGLGIGHVISIDTAHHSALFCGRLEYYQKKRVLWATIKPVLRQVNGKDTLYMRADTFYSAPMVKIKPNNKIKEAKSKIDSLGKATDTTNVRDKNIQIVSHAIDTVNLWVHDRPDKTADTLKMTVTQGKEDTVAISKKQKHKKGLETKNSIIADTSAADTTAPLYFIGYHHVRIFSDSLQGKCDSVCYTRSDSTIRMMYAPIVWAHNSQITGDTILLHLDSSELRSLYVPSNAFVISQSGPAKAKLFDQVQGKTLTAYFRHNTITNAVVVPNAESIYYPTDEKGAYMGMNQSKSERMRIYFEDQKIVDIKLESDANIIMTPMEKVDFPNARLSRFKWLIDLRPKTKEELFR